MIPASINIVDKPWLAISAVEVTDMTEAEWHAEANGRLITSVLIDDCAARVLTVEPIGARWGFTLLDCDSGCYYGPDGAPIVNSFHPADDHPPFRLKDPPRAADGETYPTCAAAMAALISWFNWRYRRPERMH